MDTLKDNSFTSLDDILNAHIETKEEVGNLIEWPDNKTDPRLLRVSYSSIQDFASCPRKFQLKKLNATESKKSQDDWRRSLTFAFGHFLGAAVQDKLLGELSDDQILLNNILLWGADFFDENPRQAKSLFHAIHGFELFKAQVEEGFLADYEVAMFRGKPASELSFRLHYPNGSTYRGFVDLILRNKRTGEYVILELKTSSAMYVNHIQYKNSEQALGYSIVLDKIVEEEHNGESIANYTVEYLVYFTKRRLWENFSFPKTYVQRALWLRDRIWDSEVIDSLVATEGNMGIWPTRSQGCNTFNTPCEFIDSCHMSTESLVRNLRDTDLEEDTEYDFDIKLEDLL